MVEYQVIFRHVKVVHIFLLTARYFFFSFSIPVSLPVEDPLCLGLSLTLDLWYLLVLTTIVKVFLTLL